jgi:hypothetical protein
MPAPLKLSERFIQSLPAGVTPEQVRLVHCAAEVTETTELDAQTMEIAGIKAAGAPMITDGKPTVMKVSAWMVHEGVNRNRQGFVRDELQVVAPVLFRAPNYGVMDFNHSAVAYFSEEPKVIGLWDSAEYRYDEKAQKYGILVNGIMFSWLFPDHADTLLAEQSRKGRMSFSMACIASSIEIAQDEHGVYEVLHNPVFFTLSALDVAPADPDALGVGSEDTAESKDTLRQRLLAAALNHPWQADLAFKAAELTPESNEGAAMENELNQDTPEAAIEAPAAAVEPTEVAAEVAPEVTPEAADAVAAESTEVSAEAGATEPEAAAPTEDVAVETPAVEAVDVAQLQTRVDELTLARDAALESLNAAMGKIAELETEVAELRAKVTAVDAQEAAEARSAKLASRLAMLPEAFRKAHGEKDAATKERLENKWVAMEDAEWEPYMKDELLSGYTVEMKLSYLDRTRREGGALPTGGDAEKGDIGSRVRKLLGR